jgi:hypothetical protein
VARLVGWSSRTGGSQRLSRILQLYIFGVLLRLGAPSLAEAVRVVLHEEQLGPKSNKNGSTLLVYLRCVIKAYVLYVMQCL